MNAIDMLNAAAGHMKQRAGTYDQPDGERSMRRTVAAFNAVKGREVLTESDGWLLMELLKLARDQSRDTPHQDSLEDAVAYAALYGEARMAGARATEPAADADGWIEWSGGGCPVPADTVVDVRFRNGDESITYRNAGGLDWQHDHHPRDIIAYRIVRAGGAE